MREPIWIDLDEVLVIHERLLMLHGGAPGLRDEGLLESALARPQQYAAYSDAIEIVELAAIYTAAIVKNHPFVDGNKRTGFVLGILFLEVNGLEFTATQEDAANAVIALAGSAIDEMDYARFIKENSTLPGSA